MYEEIIKEIVEVKKINLNCFERAELTRFIRRPNPERKQLSVVRRWADKLDIPPKLVIELSKYNDMEEIWK